MGELCAGQDYRALRVPSNLRRAKRIMRVSQAVYVGGCSHSAHSLAHLLHRSPETAIAVLVENDVDLVEENHSHRNAQRAFQINLCLPPLRRALNGVGLLSSGCGSGCGSGRETKKKRKKRRITESTLTPTHGGFRSSKLDTVAGSARAGVI